MDLEQYKRTMKRFEIVQTILLIVAISSLIVAFSILLELINLNYS